MGSFTFKSKDHFTFLYCVLLQEYSKYTHLYFTKFYEELGKELLNQKQLVHAITNYTKRAKVCLV